MVRCGLCACRQAAASSHSCIAGISTLSSEPESVFRLACADGWDSSNCDVLTNFLACMVCVRSRFIVRSTFSLPRKPPPPPTMMLENNNSIIHSSNNQAATFNKVSASGRVSEVLACSCSTYAGRPPSWV